eukprot:CAMPEP_0171451862 /NCGR_PEP_ID=MMETSP0945-20130129/195_1 /TAXON_ID=109269 /ORGANISM="Vaucheria litorea, Strain CCMP2940" /LENGTH=110 /DNA_ID=CAMNT_0011976403 /DNA_START=231 /DNA_END=563 /DNA_ORIENTATION=+
MSESGKEKIVRELISRGNAEWKEQSKISVLLYWESPKETASKLYKWVEDNFLKGNVLTVYELHKGEDMKETEFFGMDEIVLRKAIDILEKENKAAVLKGSTCDEDGVKFF